MRWSWKIGTAAGIGVYIHWTFLLLIGYVLFATRGAGLAVQLAQVAFIAALFGCIVLHELGHALMARRFGIPTRDITLLPIGGVARLERMPEDPNQEFLVAIAGPAVNVVIAAILLVLLVVSGNSGVLARVPENAEMLVANGLSFLATLMYANVMLVLFNLLPAFPMDGGRMLRAFLAMLMDYGQATNVASIVGQVMSVGLGLLGFAWGNPFLMLLAFFVFMGARSEASMVEVRLALRGVPVRMAMMTRFYALSPQDSLQLAIQEMLRGGQHDFPVVEGDRVVGALYKSDLLQALAATDRDRRVSEVMRPDCRVAGEHEMLEAVFQRMNEAGCSMVPVVRGERLVGILTLENVGELLMIQSAQRRQPQRPVPVEIVPEKRIGGELERDYL